MIRKNIFDPLRIAFCDFWLRMVVFVVCGHIMLISLLWLDSAGFSEGAAFVIASILPTVAAFIIVFRRYIVEWLPIGVQFRLLFFFAVFLKSPWLVRRAAEQFLPNFNALVRRSENNFRQISVMRAELRQSLKDSKNYLHLRSGQDRHKRILELVERVDDQEQKEQRVYQSATSIRRFLIDVISIDGRTDNRISRSEYIKVIHSAKMLGVLLSSGKKKRRELRVRLSREGLASTGVQSADI